MSCGNAEWSWTKEVKKIPSPVHLLAIKYVL